MDQWDAIVVGAGPAGSTCARELAAAGVRVLVVDRAEFPRYKACGGGIPLRTERLLPFPIDSVVEDSVNLLDVGYRGKRRFRRDSGTPFAHMVMRDRFDALLLDQARKAGAEFRPGTAVRSLDLNGTATVGSEGFEAEAPFVVCADGAHSPVGKMAGLGTGLAECAAWEIEARRADGVGDEWRAMANINLGFRPWGYSWVFPKEEMLSIGIVLPPEHGPKMKRAVARYVEQMGLDAASIEVAKGHKIRFRRGGEPIAGERVLLAGDAAGLADEFTQEGIGYAVESGRLAARNVLRGLGGDGDLRRYEADIDREVMPELEAARIIGHMFYGVLGRMPGPWLAATGKFGTLWNAFFAVQKGESTYAREAARWPVLPGMARRTLRERDTR